MANWLAHSAKHARPTQSYAEHISNVTRGAVIRARRMLRHYKPKDAKLPRRRALLAIAADAASYHDFGKLDDANQGVLAGKSARSLPIRHEDAGVALLSRFGAVEAAGLVSAHHRGLPKYLFEQQWPTLNSPVRRKLDAGAFRSHVQSDHQATAEATDRNLEQYLVRHEQVLGSWCGRVEPGLSQCKGFARRLLLACLVDADHSDTARHYGQAPPESKADLRWAERLAALDRYVAGLAKGNAGDDAARQARIAIRVDLYAACRSAETDHPLRSCDAVVGSGKTTAVMAHLLRVAAERKLRHIFVVLPYTNIIRQSVEVYRDALCLEGEVREEVVAEHHHQAAFKDMDLRHLTTLWRAPVIVTTAVQFFETLASNHTGRLRKLHELPGSAVFLDEAHAALPSALWPVCWNWLQEWTAHWNGHLVLTSGSLPEFWTLPDFQLLTEGRDPGRAPKTPVPDVRPLAASLRERMDKAEHDRVRFATKPEPMSVGDLIDWVEENAGPRLVIVNTVQSAAVLAQRMQQRDKQVVMHLSTALAPIHRVTVIDKIKELLESRDDWTLVATSMVEAGLNFSFKTGFRQRSSTASLVQTAGRVNRGAEKGGESRVWDFDLKDTDVFPNNPSLRRSREAISILFADGRISPDYPADLQSICLQAMQYEFSPKQQVDALQRVKLESGMDYPQVAELCRVIESDTRLVLIDRGLLPPIRGGRKLPHSELIGRSIQLYSTRIANLGFERVLESSDELYVLPEGWEYDPDCFGYMAGWLRQQHAVIPRGFIL
jgi:CRISPR-associated endonuclease/helicase Cas3